MGTIRCPKCRKMINERDRKCTYCGFDGIASYRAALSRTEREAKKKQQEKWNKAMQDVMKSEKADTKNKQQEKWNKAIQDVMKSEKADTKNNVPKCPTCSSTNIKKIGSVNKTVSIALFGIFSSKIGKQFQCLECGYKW